MLQISCYTPSQFEEWNRFVAQSKNGTFLFDRRYMDYHQDRFVDHSLLFYDERGLLALLPANMVGDRLVSHQGLTYGGLVMSPRTTASQVCELLSELNGYLRTNGFRSVEYKPVPWVYHRLPSEEDLYALFVVCHARLTGRDISSAIRLDARQKWSHGRCYCAHQARKNGVVVEPSEDFAAFWQVLTDNLMGKYGVMPVHSLKDILLLKSRFPENILLYVARWRGEIIGGTVLYHCGETLHAQYISATPEGKRLHAIDAIYEQILLHDFVDVPYFDFGKSTVGDGYELNRQLIFQKEGFGGRGICYDTYEWEP